MGVATLLVRLPDSIPAAWCVSPRLLVFAMSTLFRGKFTVTSTRALSTIAIPIAHNSSDDESGSNDDADGGTRGGPGHTPRPRGGPHSSMLRPTMPYFHSPLHSPAPTVPRALPELHLSQGAAGDDESGGTDPALLAAACAQHLAFLQAQRRQVDTYHKQRQQHQVNQWQADVDAVSEQDRKIMAVALVEEAARYNWTMLQHTEEDVPLDAHAIGEPSAAAAISSDDSHHRPQARGTGSAPPPPPPLVSLVNTAVTNTSLDDISVWENTSVSSSLPALAGVWNAVSGHPGVDNDDDVPPMLSLGEDLTWCEGPQASSQHHVVALRSLDFKQSFQKSIDDALSDETSSTAGGATIATVPSTTRAHPRDALPTKSPPPSLATFFSLAPATASHTQRLMGGMIMRVASTLTNDDDDAAASSQSRESGGFSGQSSAHSSPSSSTHHHPESPLLSLSSTCPMISISATSAKVGSAHRNHHHSHFPSAPVANGVAEVALHSATASSGSSHSVTAASTSASRQSVAPGSLLSTAFRSTSRHPRVVVPVAVAARSSHPPRQCLREEGPSGTNASSGGDSRSEAVTNHTPRPLTVHTRSPSPASSSIHVFPRRQTSFGSSPKSQLQVASNLPGGNEFRG